MTTNNAERPDLPAGSNESWSEAEQLSRELSARLGELPRLCEQLAQEFAASLTSTLARFEAMERRILNLEAELSSRPSRKEWELLVQKLQGRAEMEKQLIDTMEKQSQLMRQLSPSSSNPNGKS